jgi:hypothetical protein
MAKNGPFIQFSSLRSQMERFYDNDPDKEKEPFFGRNDDDDDDEDDDDDFDEEGIAFIDQSGMLDMMQMDLAQTELDHALINKAADIAKQSWLWYFKSHKTKMREIKSIFRELFKITYGPSKSKKKDKKEKEEK